MFFQAAKTYKGWTASARGSAGRGGRDETSARGVSRHVREASQINRESRSGEKSQRVHFAMRILRLGTPNRNDKGTPRTSRTKQPFDINWIIQPSTPSPPSRLSATRPLRNIGTRRALSFKGVPLCVWLVFLGFLVWAGRDSSVDGSSTMNFLQPQVHSAELQPMEIGPMTI